MLEAGLVHLRSLPEGLPAPPRRIGPR